VIKAIRWYGESLEQGVPGLGWPVRYGSVYAYLWVDE